MKELSLNILDVAENSVKAGATLTKIILEETAEVLTLKIIDDGCGMSEEVVKAVVDPFYTTRTTRSVGLGVPLLKLAAEQTGGSLSIESKTADASPDNHGTAVTATFNKNHLDFTPLGDIISTVTTLIQGHPETDFLFVHTMPGGEVSLNTKEIRDALGGDVPLDTFDVIQWIKGSLEEEYNSIENQ